MSAIPPGLARLLGRATAAAKPGTTDLQQLTRVALEKALKARIPEPIQRLAATEATLRPYTEPHNRRQFFRNAIGLPHRHRQIESMLAEPKHDRLDENLYEASEEARYDPSVEQYIEDRMPELEDLKKIVNDGMTERDARWRSGLFTNDAENAQIQDIFSRMTEAVTPAPEPEPPGISALFDAIKGRFNRR